MRKAVSPLVAAVLLIAVTMTIAAILSYWASGFVRSRTEEWEERLPAGECSFANFRIYSCSYSDTNGEFTIILENIRNVKLRNITAFVIYDNGTIQTQSVLADLDPSPAIKTYTISGVSPNYNELSIKTHCSDVSATDDCR